MITEVVTERPMSHRTLIFIITFPPIFLLKGKTSPRLSTLYYLLIET